MEPPGVDREVTPVHPIQALAARRRDDEDGFTLIELMVVVLIIAILIAIAIPTFLGARQRAQDRAAQSDLRNALTAEKVVYTDLQAYTTDITSVAPNGLKYIESSLDWAVSFTPTMTPVQQTGVEKGNVTTGTTVTDGVVCLTEVSKSGTTFVIKDVSAGTNAGTWFGKTALATCDDTPLAASW
jgi:type IV pilus assembly protein PilA